MIVSLLRKQKAKLCQRDVDFPLVSCSWERTRLRLQRSSHISFTTSWHGRLVVSMKHFWSFIAEEYVCFMSSAHDWMGTPPRGSTYWLLQGLHDVTGTRRIWIFWLDFSTVGGAKDKVAIFNLRRVYGRHEVYSLQRDEILTTLNVDKARNPLRRQQVLFHW